MAYHRIITDSDGRWQAAYGTEFPLITPPHVGARFLRFDLKAEYSWDGGNWVLTDPVGGPGGITVQEADGTPAIAGADSLIFDQADGFVVSDLGAGDARVDLSGVPESVLNLNFPTHSSANDPSTDEKAALVGTNGVPSATNKYVTNSDPRNSDARVPTAHEVQSAGGFHTAGGLTIGHVLRATGATAFAFGAIQDADLPGSIARDSEVTAAISAHEGAADPHTGYQKESEKGVASGYADLDAGVHLPLSRLTDFVASGAGHARGIVPDPGAGAGTTKYLREDATWQVPPDTGITQLTGDVTAGPGSGSQAATIPVQMTITKDVSGLKLVNDATSPGVNQTYGTDGAGVKGWKADPAGGSGLTHPQVLTRVSLRM